MTWTYRLALFADKLQAIKKELDQRSLSELSTEKLYDLYLKYSNGFMNAAPEMGLVKDKDKPEKAKGLVS
jgi:hypothetical protein